jgi:aspartyl-tRNA(Asn)/glutamyl-tRNA(Gln) amidotransferase subunit A
MTARPPSIAELGRRFRDGSLRPSAWARSRLNAIARLNPKLRCIFRATSDLALAEAHAADRDLEQGIDRGFLHGIPYVVADVIDVAGEPTTCGSVSMADFIATRDATVITRLRACGAVLLGKSSIFEFALGSPVEDSEFPAARNPWDLSRIAGATGGGAAVITGLASFAITPDTGGAARASAALCGVAGFKPTFAAISCEGFHQAAPSLDHCGLIAGSASEISGAFNLLAEEKTKSLLLGLKGLRVGVVSGMPGLHPDAVQAIVRAVQFLKECGVVVATIDSALLDEILPIAHTIYAKESFDLYRERLRRSPNKLGQATRDRLVAGIFVTTDVKKRAVQVAHDLTARVDKELFGKHDLLILPSAAGAAPVFQASPYGAVGRSGAQTLPFNLTGNPAASAPCGFSNGLPVGVQIAGRHGEDLTVLTAAEAITSTYAQQHSPSVPLETA